jgi:CheY-like chemotaxis protein
VTRLALAIALAFISLLGSVMPDVALVDDVSTARRVLGTALGSVDGALIARAVTLNEERTPVLAGLYLGAVAGGGAIGYAVADSDDALKAMAIAMIPLIVVNIALPRTSLRAAEEEPVASWKELAIRCVPAPAADGWRASPIHIRF